MNTYKIVEFLCLILLLCFSPASLICQEFAKDVVEIQEVLSSGVSVNIRVERKKIPESFIYKDSYMWGGDINIMPNTVIVTIDIKLANEKIYIPFSAYGDLGNPSTVTVKKADNNFSLIISGGDAGGSYTAILFFENGYIVKRKVMHNEFPEEVWEETVYSFNDIDG